TVDKQIMNWLVIIFFMIYMLLHLRRQFIEQTNNELIYDNIIHDLSVSSSSSSQIYTSVAFDDDLNASFSFTSQIQALESNLTLDDPISNND
ncbi:7719_t:CDS:2, partial [Gigaspora rosea]